MRLDKEFFAKPAESVAEDLLNNYVVRNFEEERRGRILATESYVGKQTRDKDTIYEEPGTIYMYPFRGNYILNVTTGEEGSPECVLIRETEIDDEVCGPIKTTRELDINSKDWDGRSIINDELYFDDLISFEEVPDQETCKGRWKVKG